MMLELNEHDLEILNKYLINGVFWEVAPLIDKINKQLKSQLEETK